MIRWLRSAFSVGACNGGTSGEDADAAVARGMVDVLAVLDHTIDDDTALRRVYAGISENAAPAAAPARARGTGVHRQRRAQRRRAPLRLGLRPAAALAAALAAGAVALAVIQVPGLAHDGTQGRAVDTAYVLKRVDNALRAAGPGAIAQLTITTHPMAASSTRGAGGSVKGAKGPTVTEEWSYGNQWRVLRNESSGQPALDFGYSHATGYTEVNYKQRSWARSRELGFSGQGDLPGGLGRPGSHSSRPGPDVSATPRPTPASGASGCGQVLSDLQWLVKPGLPAADGTAAPAPGTVAATVRDAVSCGALSVTGRQHVDGIEAIELSSRPGSLVNETVWVDPATYLPVRIEVRMDPGASPASGTGVWRTANITWLPLTAQNLAKLTVPVPAGFTRVSPAEIRQPTSNK